MSKQHYKTIDQCVGGTPLVQLQRLNPNPSNIILAKLEGNNPAGSVKDRAALNMINEAENRGDIKPCLLYTSPSPRDRTRSRMPSSA